MLSKAIKWQEKSFDLLWDKSDDVSSETWLSLCQTTDLIEVKITKAQKYGVEKLIKKGRGSIVESLNLQAKQNYLTLANALGK